MSKLKVLVVGAGMYVAGRGTDGYGTILPALFKAAKEGLVASIKVAATSPASVNDLKNKVAGLGKSFGFQPEIEYFPSNGQKDVNAYKKALQQGEKPDCAIVSVPDHLHFEVTSFLVENGIHCLVAKPLAPTVEEVKKLIKIQADKKVYGAVEFHKRYDRSNLKLKDALEQGLIGDPLSFLVEYSQRKSIPTEKFKNWVDRTNIFQYLGIHYLDIIYFATRALPLRVMAVGQKGFLAARGIDNYDSIQCVTEWKTKAGKRFTSTFLTNWIDPESTSAMSDQKIKVIGTRGRYEANQKNRGIFMVTDEKGIEEPNPDFSSFYGAPGSQEFSFQGYGVDSLMQFIKDVSAVIGGQIGIDELDGTRPTFKESLVPVAILEAANSSLARNGEWVKIEGSIANG